MFDLSTELIKKNPGKLAIVNKFSKQVRESFYGGQLTFIYQLINQTFVSTPHRRSTTVSLETKHLFIKLE